MSAVIAYRNWFDGVGSIPAWTFNYAGLGYPDQLQAVAGFPAENLRKRQLSEVARFELTAAPVSGPCAVEFVASGGGFPVALIGVVGANLPDSILYKPSGSGFVSAEMLTGYSPSLAIPSQCFALVPVGTTVEKVRLLWNDPPTEYYELARVFIADAIVLPNGVNAAWSLGFDDSGDLAESAGSQWYSNEKLKTRRLSISLFPLTPEVSFGVDDGGVAIPSLTPVPSMLDLQMYAGTTGEVIVLPRSTGEWAYRAGIYGHIERPFEIQHVAGPNFRANLAVIEER